jgi:hypothetical protein
VVVDMDLSHICKIIGHGSNSGIKGLRNLGIGGILSILIYRFYPLIPQFLNA